MSRSAHFRLHLDLRRTASAVCRRRPLTPAHRSRRSSRSWSTSVPRSPPTSFLTQLADQRRLWEPLVTFDPWSRSYVRLAAEAGIEAWLLTWLPGQGTEWLDHGGSAGGFLTVHGTLTERQAMVHRDAPPRIRPEVRTVPTGLLRPFGTKHIHRVTNEGAEPAVSLHAYAPVLVEMNEYTVDGDRLRLVAAQRAGQSW